MELQPKVLRFFTNNILDVLKFDQLLPIHVYVYVLIFSVELYIYKVI